VKSPSVICGLFTRCVQAADDADGLVAMEKQHLLQLKKSLETELGLIQQQLKVRTQ